MSQEGNPTPEQAELIAEANRLMGVVDRVVPRTTIHYAVEQLRAALETLQRNAPRILTHATATWSEDRCG
jgi:hypothetical protein